MSAQPAEAHGLSEAQQRLDELLVRLNSTVELAGELANAGEDETALRLLAQQRAHLYSVVDSLSRDIGTGPRRPWATIRRHVGLVAAATIMMLSCAGAALVAAQTTPAERASEDLQKASRLVDPAARLTALLSVHDRSASLPPADGARLRARAVSLVEQTEPKVPDDPENDEIRRRAEKLTTDVNDAQRMEPPEDPDDVGRVAAEVEDILE